jgi:hypothetical protein
MLECATPTGTLMPYRISLFYGPECIDQASGRVHCVFNVKKRSWRAGTQVAVELDEEQLAHARRITGLEVRMQTALASLPDSARQDAEQRVPDLLAQAVCATKLDLAIEKGLPQENLTIPAEDLREELKDSLSTQCHRIIDYVLTELDLAQEP